MKRLLVGAILIIFVWSKVTAQTKTLTRVYIYNASRGNTLLIQPADKSKKSIGIRSFHWSIFQINSDSLGLSSKGQSYFIRFERGKNYYFIAQADSTRVFVVNETSEREFLLTVHANNSDKPEEYTLDN